jgi:hypothetical protein
VINDAAAWSVRATHTRLAQHTEGSIMDLLGPAGLPEWTIFVLGILTVLIPRLTGVAILALVLRGSRPADRPALLKGLVECLPHLVTLATQRGRELRHRRQDTALAG